MPAWTSWPSKRRLYALSSRTGKRCSLAKSQIIVRQLEIYFLTGSLPPIIKNQNLASWLEAYPLTMKMFEYRSKLNSRARSHICHRSIRDSFGVYTAASRLKAAGASRSQFL
ncbi:PREDICTED: uncharacterized protein LOC105133527 [Populus euphratica]|uniref:Uncharacterized protein LOC105133527 n=1 Tax=Populus euphratica TaxID=75702 RepID=A0AAJ6UUI8_POPEU|nr:PREDICTED: uncharacterized protein LOC105133527 [Populus euphratica]